MSISKEVVNMEKKVFIYVIACIIIAASTFIVSKTYRSQCESFLDDNIEALMDLELNQPIWIIHHWENGDYNCTKGGSEICVEDDED